MTGGTDLTRSDVSMAALPLAAMADAVLSEDLHWLPIRHHSPHLAQLVKKTILLRKPQLVFIEAPVETEHLVPHLVDKKTRPPVAMYSALRREILQGPSPDDGEDSTESVRSKPPERLASWYPLMEYSPELVAMRAADAVGAKVVFIDLPHWARDAAAEGSLDEDAPAQPNPAVPEPTERFADQSDFYRGLAKAAGFRTYDEAWDVLFETRPKADTGADGSIEEDPRRDVLLFCAAVRSQATEEAMRSDGTLARERFMWSTIQRTLRDQGVAPRDAVVVCGGFHAFMDRPSLEELVPEKNPLELSETEALDTALVPFSSFRISELSGYGAGNRAPDFYGALWEGLEKGKTLDEVLIRHTVKVLARARRSGEALAAADAISVHAHVQMLSALRDRLAPVLDDLEDAILSCCCKGDPAVDGAPLLKAMREVAIGTRVGRATPDAGQLPLVADFYEQVDALGLEQLLAREAVQNYTLDRSEPLDARRSAFLHRLLGIGVPIGSFQSIGGVFGDSLFREAWRVKWSPTMEPSLIELNLYGESVELAATAHTLERLMTSGGAEDCTTILSDALKMQLDGLATRALEAVRAAVEEDERFRSLAGALGQLLTLHRHAHLRSLPVKTLDELIRRAFEQATFALPGVASVPPEEHEGIVMRLSTIIEPVLQREDLDRSLLVDSLRAAHVASTQPFLRGAFLGALGEAQALDDHELPQAIRSFAQAAPDEQVAAGEFMQGVLSTSRAAIATGSGPVAGALTELLDAVEWETFLMMLPKLRAGFEGLGRRVRGEFSKKVAVEIGLESGAELTRLATSAATAALIASADRRAEEILCAFGLGSDS